MSTAIDEVPEWLRELCQRLQSEDKAMLKVINLNIRRVNYPMMAALCDVLRYSEDLQSLNLTSSLVDRLNMTSSQVIEPLIDSVLCSATCLLQILHLSYNKITGPLNGIGKALSVNRSLKELYLDHNRIDCTTAEELAIGLRSNETLQVLQLSSNLIGDEGASHLASALKYNQSLRTLGLSRNFIGDNGAQAFVDALWKYKNTSMTVLDLQNNPSVGLSVLGWVESLCDANAHGRKILLYDMDSIPGLGAYLLARNAPSVIFLFLQEVQSIVPSSSLERSATTASSPKKKARC